MREHLCYVNGALVPPREARVSMFDTGFVYGVTLYESLRTFRQCWYLLDEHWRRMEHSLEYAGLRGLLSRETFGEVMECIRRENLPCVPPGDELWACIQVTPGETYPMPLAEGVPLERPTLLAFSTAIHYAAFVDGYEHGTPVLSAPFRSPPPQCYDQRMKCRSRLPHYLNRREIARRDPKAWALMLDVDGYLTEGTNANIFLVQDGALHTPTGRDILLGCSRQRVIELAAGLGLEVVERDITLAEAYRSQEAFWTATSVCILPIASLDGQRLGAGVPGPVTRRLLAAWSAEVGVDIVAHARRYATLSRP